MMPKAKHPPTPQKHFETTNCLQDSKSSAMIINRLTEILTSCNEIITCLAKKGIITMSPMELSHNQAYLDKVKASLKNCLGDDEENSGLNTGRIP